MCRLFGWFRRRRHLDTLIDRLEDVVEVISHDINKLPCNRKAARFRWQIGPVETSPNSGEVAMSLILKDNQRVTINVSPVDAKGNPAQVDGAPVWAVVGPGIVTLEPSTDGFTCVATTTGELGTTQLTVTADADVGEGAQAISGLLDVEVVGGVAVSLAIAAGIPEDIPAAPVEATPAAPVDETPAA